MADHTKIEWCDATVNWWVGCTQVSPACDHCYAKRIAAPFWGQKWGPGVPRQRFDGAAASLKALDRKAQRLGRKLTVFHNSVSDMFDNEVPDTWRMDAFQAMADTPNLIHLVLTKLIGNVRPYTQRDGLAFDLIGDGRVRLGITVCNQEEADRDIPKLLAVEASTRFLSIEPMLGAVDLTKPLGLIRVAIDQHLMPNHYPDLDWVIVGGESGPGARPVHPDWVRALRDQCQASRTPFLFKQWGEWRPAETVREAGLRPCIATNRVHPSRSMSGCSHLEHQVESMLDGKGQYAHIDCAMFKAGKKAAGRLLDGVEHNGRPA